MLTDPELTGLIALRSRLPEFVGGGKLKPGMPDGDAAGIAPGKPGGRPCGGACCAGGGCCGVWDGVVDGPRPAASSIVSMLTKSDKKDAKRTESRKNSV